MDIARQLVDALNLEVVETLSLPARAETRSAMPEEIAKGPLGSKLPSIAPDATLWTHQSAALRHLSNGRNVVVGTGTASGKSLIFQLYALHRLKQDEKARAMVFYPLKALAADQHARWIAMARTFGLPEGSVGRIDGDIPTDERGAVLASARIVIMTPDVCQAWLMRTVGSGSVRRFLDGLALLVLDEAHVYESVFGSNVAFLLRRLIAAKRKAQSADSSRSTLQIIAATATIAEPAEHLRELTGQTFSVVDESQNGAPQHERIIFHINGADHGADGDAALIDILRGVRRFEKRHRFIAFIDSRQGTERIVREIGEAGVLPYRSGYEAEDRKRIETRLRDGSLDGVVATSALELGIDIADMAVGVNLGVPETRKAFRQRIGRIGRTGSGVFFVIAPPSAFRRYGETFKDYYEGSIEPSYLYLGNRFVQFAHARCLVDEMEVLELDRSAPPPGVSWPNGFDQALRFARPGGGRPREYDLIAQLGADAPHHNYPLRQVGEASFMIVQGSQGIHNRIGSIAANQAIREAYPGANYLHLGRSYRVREWRTTAFERAIRVEASMKHIPARPLLRKTVTLSFDPAGIVDNRIKQSKTGLLAEVNLQVNESVEGYRVGANIFLYKDLRSENPNMSRKQRDFRTTGVIVQIDEPWFSGKDAAAARGAAAEGLLGLVCRERSIASQDVDATHTNIAVLSEQGPKRLTNSIVIYDAVYGGLRLTEDLYENFESYVEQLDRAAELAGPDAIVSGELTSKLMYWTSGLCDVTAIPKSKIDLPDGWHQIYRPGSVVALLYNGNLIEREIIEPRLVDPFGLGTKSLYYAYAVNSARAFIPHDQVQATGHDWFWILWNPQTNKFKEIDDEWQKG